MIATLIDRQFEANLWANETLIALCATLDDEQLMVEGEGVFGRIRPTIVHILQGEGNYLRDLAGANPWADLSDWDNLSFDQLLAMAKQSGAALREAAKRGDPDQTIEYEDEDEFATFKRWTVLNQAIHHGIEHRTQLKILLTKLGVPHPDLSVWGFAAALGELQITPKATRTNS